MRLSEEAGDRRIVVMVVEDDADQREELVELIESALARETLTVIEHGDATSALADCQTRTPDMILLDYRLPGGNGVSLIQNIRQIPQVADIPLIMITGEADRTILRDALHAGANDFVRKPFDAIELTARVRNMLALRMRQRELADAVAELERLAATDPLTGVPNRRAFMDRIGIELTRVQRYARPISVLILDIDRFKSVNDQHGHGVGDEVLCSVAHAMSRHLRATDFMARLGGEEFVVALPETSLADAAATAERIRAETAGLKPSIQVPELRVTISIGVAEALETDRIESLLEAADKALYLAKTSGRDQVQLAER